MKKYKGLIVFFLVVVAAMYIVGGIDNVLDAWFYGQG